MRTKKLLFIVLFIASITSVNAQDLLEILDNERPESPTYATAAFKFSRITFGHSVETRKKGTLDIFGASRFWDTPSERSQSFLAEKVSVRMGLEYGVSDRLLIGAGWTSFDGRFDGFVKYKLAQQRTDGKGLPFSVTLFQNASYFSEPFLNTGANPNLSKRGSFTTQVLIAKKFSPKFSFQLSPTFIHRGLIYQESDPQSHFALGFGGRYRLGSHVFAVSEYYHVFNPITSVDRYGAFSVGVNWELSDVMLQFMLTNAVSMVEDAFIADTRNNFNFKPPNLNFGFNFTYTFHLKKAIKISEEK